MGSGQVHAGTVAGAALNPLIRFARPNSVEWETDLYPPSKFRNYFGHLDRIDRGPQAFEVFRDAPGVIEPHFHPIDQFQVFVRGADLALGKADCDPVAVHYTDGFSPYGPITWGDDGITFFNLRARADTGANWMPASREMLVRRAGRYMTAHCSVEETSAAGKEHDTWLIPPHEDGLLVFARVAGPGEELTDETAGGAGRFEFVLSGELVLEQEPGPFPAHSIVFVPAGMRLPRRRAGASGVHTLTMQSPFD
jgi:hypothetical protein